MKIQITEHHLGALRHGHGRHVWFDVAGTPGDPSALITAELRIHQAPPHDVDDPTSLYTVVVHRVINVDSMGYELKFLKVVDPYS